MQEPPILDPRTHALFLDFDGTLAPLQNDPATVFLEAAQTAALLALDRSVSGAMAVISGRDIQDLSLRIPSDLMRIGGHGLDISRPGELASRSPGVAPEDLASAFADAVAAFDDVWVEPKGRVLAVHYRANPDAEENLMAVLASAVADHPDYSLQAGKMVFEAKPSIANKGVALKRTMQTAPFAGRTPVMIGDDMTDEDAMLVASELRGFGVKVGAGDSAARFMLSDPKAVWAWLEALS